MEDDRLTLATLCDMLLGEDATDRENFTLIKAVRMKLVRIATLETALNDLFVVCSDLPLEEMDRMGKEIDAASKALKG